MIKELTKEQEALIEEYRIRGIKDGINTEPITDKKILESVEIIFNKILKEEKTEIVICSSPQDAWDKIKEKYGVDELDYIHPYLDGHMFSFFFAYYDYMKDVLGVEFDCLEEYEALRNCLNLGPLFKLEDVCFVSKKPVMIHMNSEDQYHNEKGPAVEYEDGFSLWFLNGVSVPEWLVTTEWKDLDAKRFATIKNVEVRREFVRKIGVERLVQKLNPEVLDKKDDYELLHVDLGGETGKWPYLKMKNPSIGIWHVECVGKDCRTVEDAIKFRNGSSLTPKTLT